MLLSIQRSGVDTGYDLYQGHHFTRFFISVAPAEINDTGEIEVDVKEYLAPAVTIMSRLVDSEKFASVLEDMARMIREKYV